MKEKRVKERGKGKERREEYGGKKSEGKEVKRRR